MKNFSLRDFPLENKTVLVRVDYNVPLEKENLKGHQRKNNLKVADNTKISASLPTINFLLQKNCKIVLATHLGRPKGRDPELKVDPLAQELQKMLPQNKIIKLNDCFGAEIREKIISGKPQQIFFLENLRFYSEEEQNDQTFAHSLAELAQVYVNEAFSNSHRAHASMEAITNYLPSLPGFWLEQEIKYLQLALNPQKPALWLMGGAKLDKMELIQQALKKADLILIGGALAFSFLRAKGVGVGMSKMEVGAVELAKKMLQKKEAQKKIVLPLDFIAAEKMAPNSKTEIVAYNEIDSQQTALDIGPQTIALFKNYLSTAATIVWNGPLGYFEWEKFSSGTKEIGRFMKEIDCIKIAGGGETAEAIHKFNLAANFTHLSTGGGASLMYLSGKKLPGLVALENNYDKNAAQAHTPT